MSNTTATAAAAPFVVGSRGRKIAFPADLNSANLAAIATRESIRETAEYNVLQYLLNHAWTIKKHYLVQGPLRIKIAVANNGMPVVREPFVEEVDAIHATLKKHCQMETFAVVAAAFVEDVRAVTDLQVRLKDNKKHGGFQILITPRRTQPVTAAAAAAAAASDMEIPNVLDDFDEDESDTEEPAVAVAAPVSAAAAFTVTHQPTTLPITPVSEPSSTELPTSFTFSSKFPVDDVNSDTF